jgi:hypothetical protein
VVRYGKGGEASRAAAGPYKGCEGRRASARCAEASDCVLVVGRGEGYYRVFISHVFCHSFSKFSLFFKEKFLRFSLLFYARKTHEFFHISS